MMRQMRERWHIGLYKMRIAVVLAATGLWFIGAYQMQAGAVPLLLIGHQGIPGGPNPPVLAPSVRSVEPAIVGVGGKIRLRGVNLGTAQNAVVVFEPGVIAHQVERHTPNEIIVRVPIGARSGAVQVVTGVNAPALRTLQNQIGNLDGSESPPILAEIAQMKTQQGFMLSFGRFSNPVQRTIIVGYMEPDPAIPPQIEESNGLKIVRNRLIVDLKDFLSFDVALEIADRLNAKLVGHFPVTNSYVLDLRRAPKSLKELETIKAQVQKDPRVAEVWQDFLLELQQAQQRPKFADVDVVDRYRHNYNPNLHGRIDVWATDRIQAPAAWNLIERFMRREGREGRESLNPVKIAVLDSGCDQDHPEFNGVALHRVVGDIVRVRVAGRTGRQEILNLPNAYNEQPYDLGDDDQNQHGTRVISLIGARNGNIINQARGDRGMNGLLHNPMPYIIQVYRFRDAREGDDLVRVTGGVTAWLAAINMAGLTGAKIMNASVGRHVVPNPNDPDDPNMRIMRIALRKVAHQMRVFSELLLVVAAGNENSEVIPFEDTNLNNRLDDREDRNNNRTLDFGNHLAASLGTLENVIAVGATDRDDQRAIFSNWGIPVTIAAPGTAVFTAGWGGEAGQFQIGRHYFSYSSGTSFAAPLVTGSAALLKAIDPCLTPRQIKDYLHNTSFVVNTTDFEWKTLKTGYAVRQLMVDRGIIGNDQHWSGVSKVIYEDIFGGLSMFEVRRGADGRAEAFADRPLIRTGWSPTLAHHGKALIYIADERRIKLYDFTTGNTANLTELMEGQRLVRPLEAAPNNHYLYGVQTLNTDRCRQLVEFFVREGLDQAAHRVRAALVCLPPGQQGAWAIWVPFKAAWHPGNRILDIDYLYKEGNETRTVQKCRTLAKVEMYPPGVDLDFRIDGCPHHPNEFGYPAWSPDGNAEAGIRGENLVIEYRGSITHSARVGGDVLWLHWSPDGSELGCALVGVNSGIFTIRRDRRHTDDRALHALLKVQLTVPRQVFTWQW